MISTIEANSNKDLELSDASIGIDSSTLKTKNETVQVKKINTFSQSKIHSKNTISNRDKTVFRKIKNHLVK